MLSLPTSKSSERSQRPGGLAALIMAALCAALLTGAQGADPGKSEPPVPPGKIDFTRDIAPLIKKYCYKCHTGDEPEGEFSLYFEKEADFLARVSSERSHFEKMMEVVRYAKMPPKDAADQPTEAERDRLVNWVDGTVLASDDAAQRDPDS